MSNINKEVVEAGGFSVDAGGKVRLGGKMVKAAVAEQVGAGAILANFDMEQLKKKRARKNATGTSDLVSALKAISPAIELLEPGQTAKLPVPKAGPDGKDPKRSFVMSIVTKLNNITSAGREWAGRRFDSLSDEDGDFLYVARLSDTDNPKVRKTGGGRKSNAESKNGLQDALAAAKAHLNGNSEGANEEQEQQDEMPVINPGDEIKEDATVIQH